MSNKRMLALVAIVAGALFTGACADDVTGPSFAPERAVPEGEPLQLGPEAPAIKAHGEWPDEPEEE